MRIVLLRCLAGEKHFEKDLLIPLMCGKWGTGLTPSIPAKGPGFSQGELDTAQWIFPKNPHHFRNAWLWGLSWKPFLTHPKIISSLPERLWSQNINLSFFISVSTEFSPAPREEAEASAASCFAQAIHCTCPSVFAGREKPAPHQAGCLRKARRWIAAAKELFNTPRAWSVLFLHRVSWLASKTHLILLCEKAIF